MSEKIKHIIQCGDSQTVTHMISKDTYDTLKDGKTIDQYAVHDMMGKLGDQLEPGKYFLRYTKETIPEDSFMEGTRFRIDLVPIHIMSDYEYIKEREKWN